MERISKEYFQQTSSSGENGKCTSDREVVLYSQNKSPWPAPSAVFSCRCSIVHNHSGYSSSGSATGSCLFFSKFSPFSGVPAGILLLTKGVTFFFAASVAWPLSSGDGAGVRGSLRGCAAPVDVAALAEERDDVEKACRVVWDGVLGFECWRRDEVVSERLGCTGA
jgi:hypothetical protein